MFAHGKHSIFTREALPFENRRESEKIERSLLNILNITQLFNQFLLYIIRRNYTTLLINLLIARHTHLKRIFLKNWHPWKMFPIRWERVRDESRNRQSRNFFYETDNFPFINFRSVTFRKRRKESHFGRGAFGCDVTWPLAWYSFSFDFDRNFRKKLISTASLT